MTTSLHRLHHSLRITTCIALLFIVTRAHAQNAEAEKLFNDANALMVQGKLGQACDMFEASNRVEPRAGTLIRLGECREHNQQLASAWSAYRDALVRVKDPRKRELATAKARELEARMSFLTVAVSEDMRLSGLTLMRDGRPLDPVVWNQPVPVDGGDYVIVARAPDHAEWHITAHVGPERGKVVIDVPKLKSLGVPAPSPVQPGAVPVRPAVSSAPVDDLRPGGSVLTVRRKVALGIAGAGAASLVGGVVLGRAATAKRDEAYRLCPDPGQGCADAERSNVLIATSNLRALAADIAFGAAAVAVVGAGVLWLTEAPGEREARISVAPVAAGNQLGFAVSGRF